MVKKLCNYPNEEFVHDCPYSHNFRSIRCTWGDEGFPRYENKYKESETADETSKSDI